MKKAFLIHYDGYYEIRLKYVEQELVKRGYKVELVFSDFDHFSKAQKTYCNDNVRLIYVPNYQKNISVQRILSYLSFTNQVKKLINQEIPDLIYALIPPNSLAAMLAKYKKAHRNTKVIFDIFDLYPEQMPKLQNTPVATFWKSLRNKSLAKADYVILECQYYEKVLGDYLISDRKSVLYLSKPKLVEPYQFEWQDDQMSIAYLGSINHHIDIDKIVELLSAIKTKKKVIFHIIGDGERANNLIQQLEANQIEFQFYGKIFDAKKKKEILQKCQFGLNIYRENLGIGLTMKSLDYYQIGLPIINAGVYDTGLISDEFQSGINIDGHSIETVAARIVDIQAVSWNKLKENSVKVFERKFFNQIYIKTMLKIFEDVSL